MPLLVRSGEESYVIVIYFIERFLVMWVRIFRYMSCCCIHEDLFRCSHILALETSDIQENH